MTDKEIDCDDPNDLRYHCATCNVIVCDSCEHKHRDYWANEKNE